jgi:dephospho-CoA kinase
MLKIGLTGNYGMGKSTVLGEFRRLGAFAISADEVVGELLEERPVLEGIGRILGRHVFDMEGRLMKDRVAKTIFTDTGLRRALEGYLHPMVFERIEAALSSAGAEVAVVEVPLLFEGGYQGRFDRTITVYADFTTVLARLRQKGISRDDILMRHCSQMPVQEKIRHADFSIDNNGAPEKTAEQAARIYHALLSSLRTN